MDIEVNWLDHVNARIICDQSIAYEIYEQFSFMVPGAKHQPLVKAGRWDGRIRLFNFKARSFPVGLLPKLAHWATVNGYTIQINDKALFRGPQIFDPEKLERILDVSKYPPLSHQLAAVNIALTKSKGLILSPTASGKSYMIYLIVRYLLDNTDDNILITVPNTSLVEQLYANFQEYCLDDWPVEELVSRNYGARHESMDARVLITTWQSVFKKDSSFFSRYNTFLCDEAHSANQKSISSIINNLTHAERRIGFTGTLNGTMMHELEMQARFGSLNKIVTTSELMSAGVVSKIQITAISLKYPESDCKLNRSCDYQQEVDFLVGSADRNHLLAKIAIESKKNILLLFNYVEKHGDVLKRLLEPLCEKHGKKLFYIHGGVSTAEREEIRHALEESDNCILLASFGTTSTGIDVRNLHRVLFCHPYKSPIRVLQSIGRGLRLSEGKEYLELIDIGDDLTYTSRSNKKKPNVVFGHFIQRLEIYRNEKFKYKIIQLEV